jgi:hypothetical protein
MEFSRRAVARRAVLFFCALLAAAAWQSATPQEAPQAKPQAAARRLPLPESGLEWRAPAHPLKFFDSTGRRAAVFGRQSGQFEAWIYPIKLLHGFRLEFRQEGMPEAVRGEQFLEQVIARPESTTLVYVHPRFSVRQIVWTPLDERAIAVFFEVETPKPLAIMVKFVPDFKPMWPASLGGQYSYWLEEEKAFALTDGTSRPTALVGSPSVGAFTEHMDHAFVGGEMLLQLRVTPQEARATLPALVMALDMEGGRPARERYRRVAENLPALYEQRVAYHREFLERTMKLETPDAELDRAFAWARVALDAGRVCHDTYGCGWVAGYGPSGDSERPGFAWWFGGDALINSLAMLDYGDAPGARQALRFLKDRQRADGKMMHEMTQSVDQVDWFGKYGYAFYHADTTPLYIAAAAEFWRRTGERKFLEEFWPSLKKAYAYCVSTLDPADGLMDNTKAGLAAVEVGPLRGQVTKDVYLQGFWLAALEAMLEMTPQPEEADLAKEIAERQAKAEAALRGKWWNPQERYFAFGVTRDGARADRVGNWSAVLLSLPRRLHTIPPAGAAQIFARPELASDWGSRWLSNRDPDYDPISYNNGSAWPFMSGFVAWAQYEQGEPLAAFATWSSIARLTGLLSPGAVPELMNGDRFRAGERAVPHQLFSSFGVVVPAVRGLLGLRAERAPRETLLRFAPRLPAHWNAIRFANYALPEGQLGGEIRQSPGRLTAVLEFSGRGQVSLVFDPRLPMGCRVRRVLVNGRPSARPLRDAPPMGCDAGRSVSLARRAEIVVEYEGGVDIVPPQPRPEPGERTASLKILRVVHDAVKNPREAVMEVAGFGGRIYALEVVTAEQALSVTGAAAKKTERGYRLELSFDGEDYATRTIALKW